MTFAERRRLELDYKEWLKRESIKNGVAIEDCALTVIGCLDSKGLIKEPWIPCEKRLPEESKEYFVTVQHTGWNCEPTKFTSTSKYNPKTRCFECENEKWRGDKVIAWMPKPEPYKEGEQ